MYRHVFYYRLLSGLRDRETLFWTFLFPIILATFFNFAFSNLNADETFSQVPIAVVKNNDWDQDTTLQQVLQELSTDDDSLFSMQLVSIGQADSILLADEIVGYLIPGEQLEVVIRYSGLRQSILKVFADEYVQTRATINHLIKENPNLDIRSLFQTTVSLIEDQPIKAEATDNVVVYYYALIAMTCLYGGFWGLREVIAVKANLSRQAARINLAPVPKMKQFIYTMSASFVIHFASVLLLLLYLTQIIGVHFGDQILFVLLASLVGSTLGISIGALIGVLGNQSEGVKSAILIGFSMLMSFFSGLMIADMKYIVSSQAPVLRWINPANLISDAFYASYYYETSTRFWHNVVAMLIMQLVISIIVVSIMRRQRYASV
ncbi:MAG: ABC transporter permease [Eubacteriales bacterium]|nr:ABC transporter permease [Eubacteriales bacterium]